MAFNTTFNNISAISWCSVFLLEETAVTGENQRPAASHSQTLSHNVESSTPRLSGIRMHKVSGEFESNSGRVYSIQHYVIKFVSDLQQVSG